MYNRLIALYTTEQTSHSPNFLTESIRTEKYETSHRYLVVLGREMTVRGGYSFRDLVQNCETWRGYHHYSLGLHISRALTRVTLCCGASDEKRFPPKSIIWLLQNEKGRLRVWNKKTSLGKKRNQSCVLRLLNMSPISRRLRQMRSWRVPDNFSVSLECKRRFDVFLGLGIVQRLRRGWEIRSRGSAFPIRENFCLAFLFQGTFISLNTVAVYKCEGLK